ncbi:MAG: hypothetical protein JJT78_01430 [Leptospira sp.]|nr:hypothetical protein [Leptospira sp.]
MSENLKKYLLFGSLGLVVLLLLVWIFAPSDEESRFANETKEERAARMASSGDPTDSSGMPSGFDDGGSPIGGDFTNDGASPNLLLDKYKEWAQYPPNSRPMSILNHDLAFPFIVESSPDYLFDNVGDKEPNGYVCLFQPRSWAVIGIDDKMIATLECRDKKRERVKLSVNSHQVFKEFEGKRFGVASADVGDNGENGDAVAGDNIYTFQWRPMKGDWGDMTIEADITYGPGKRTKVTAAFFSSPNLPARFTGVFNERVDEGSLKVSAVLEVFKAGTYHLEANLKDKKNGEYIAYAIFDDKLKTGTQEVEFTFFGKILRDKGLDGPYIITDFRGHRVNLPIDPEWFSQGAEGLKKIQAAKTTEPDKEIVLPYKDEFETRFFDVTNFSKEAWASQEKLDRMQQLQNLADQK